MKRVLWVSRHTPLPLEIAELKRLFGEDASVATDVSPFISAEDIVERFRRGGYDEMVVVAPMSVIGRIVDEGVLPLWAEMKRVQRREDRDLEYNGRWYKFMGFKRVPYDAQRDSQDADRQHAEEDKT